MRDLSSVPLKKHLDSLRRSANPSARALAADQIGDLLEYAIQGRVNIDGNELREIFNEMMTLALSETNPETKESLLHALVSASSLARARQEAVDPDPIARALDDFNEAELEYGLYTLGFSRKLDYLPTIARFLEHPSSNIRTVARQALHELKA